MMKPRRVKEIESEALVKGPCEKVGEHSTGYDDWNTWVCELEDETMILVQDYYSYPRNRHQSSEIWLSEDERKKLREILERS